MTRRRRSEGGFALLLVYLMAAMIAILFLLELPRVAFETQRQRELLLMDRGREYEIAVKKYYKKTNQFPPTMEALDNTNQVRFLRHHFVDPMTRKDDWKILKAGPGGVVIDPDSDKNGQSQSFNPFLNNPGEKNLLPGQENINPGLKTRGSDKPLTDSTGQAGQFNPNDPNRPPDPTLLAGQKPPLPGQPGQFPGQPGQTIPGQPGQNTPGQPPTTPGGGLGNSPANSGSFNPYLNNGSVAPPGPGGQPNPNDLANRGASPNQPNTFQGPRPGINNGPGTPAGDANAAINSINNQLFNPQAGNAAAGNVLNGGIAGVASKSKINSILVYREKRRYDKWFFTFDLQRELQKAAGGGVPGQQQQPQNGGQTNPSQPPTSQPPPQ